MSEVHAEAAVRAARAGLERRRLEWMTPAEFGSQGGLWQAQEAADAAEDAALDAFARLDERERAREATEGRSDGGG